MVGELIATLIVLFYFLLVNGPDLGELVLVVCMFNGCFLTRLGCLLRAA